MKEQPRICPLCGRAYDEPPALSRMDNQTDICPRCGMMEALAAISQTSQATPSHSKRRTKSAKRGTLRHKATEPRCARFALGRVI